MKTLMLLLLAACGNPQSPSDGGATEAGVMQCLPVLATCHPLRKPGCCPGLECAGIESFGGTLPGTWACRE